MKLETISKGKPVMGKKGVLGGLQGLAMGLVVAGALVAVGALVLAELKADTTVSADGNASAAISNAQDGISNITSRFGIIATIAVMGVLLALVFRFANFG